MFYIPRNGKQSIERRIMKAKYDFRVIITCKKYSELTGLLKNKASAELRTWAEEGRILREGRAPHVVYRMMAR